MIETSNNNDNHNDMYREQDNDGFNLNKKCVQNIVKMPNFLTRWIVNIMKMHHHTTHVL